MQVALFQKIKNADFSYPSWFSVAVRELLDLVLVADPAKRLTLDEVRTFSLVFVLKIRDY